jgi:hypothetical protein
VAVTEISCGLLLAPQMMHSCPVRIDLIRRPRSHCQIVLLTNNLQALTVQSFLVYRCYKVCSNWSVCAFLGALVLLSASSGFVSVVSMWCQTKTQWPIGCMSNAASFEV